MHILRKLPLVLLSIFRALPNASALPAPAETSNVTSSVAPDSPAALAYYHYYSRCDVTFRVDLTIVDDEPFPFADEITHRSHTGTWVWYYGASNFSPVYHYSDKFGGEIRVELDFFFRIVPEAGDIGQVQYDFKLYEGTSEDTSDLDASRVGNFNFDGGIFGYPVVHLVSEEPGSADNATATFYARFDCQR